MTLCFAFTVPHFCQIHEQPDSEDGFGEKVRGPAHFQWEKSDSDDSKPATVPQSRLTSWPIRQSRNHPLPQNYLVHNSREANTKRDKQKADTGDNHTTVYHLTTAFFVKCVGNTHRPNVKASHQCDQTVTCAKIIRLHGLCVISY